MEVGYLRNWVGECGEKLWCAQIAQIRGGFINWDGRFAKLNVGVRGLRCATG